ncbi:type III-B CRISPR module RAMP protein Cmr4 [Betaproteobacteria bacterium]|nr:type III-B CRISPR module RAMP protein Cmr4 [Betaproteobacteria bacterium]
MLQKIYHVHALSALHVGTGQSVGVVDLPIARARATQLPLVPGSALKGVLRDELAGTDYKLGTTTHKTLFGPESSADSNTHAGALSVGDAHLLVLPIRALHGIVAFATSPFILQRYARDLGLPSSLPTLVVTENETEATLPKGSELNLNNKVLLEDLDLKVVAAPEADTWAERIAASLYPAEAEREWRDAFKEHFVILPDAVFSFLADTATEIRARVCINNDTRTVAPGALWYEENLPAESVLWGVLGISRSRNSEHVANAETLAQQLPSALELQIGGKHTIGRGLCRWLLSEPKN